MDLENVKILKEKAMQKKLGESESETKDRLKKVLEDRDEAMKKIYDYQDKTGIPSKEEQDKSFFEKEIKENY